MQPRKQIPEIIKQQILTDLRNKISINEIRNKTGYGVYILNRICKDANIAYNHKVMQGGNGKLYEGSLKRYFCEKSMVSNSVIRHAITEHDIIPHDKCWHCGLSEWLNGLLVLELDHINGDNRDHRIENLRYLCPNCHSQTPTYRGKSINNGKQKVSDQVLKEALKTTNNIRQALIKVGLTPKGGNYTRAQKLQETCMP